MEPEPEPLVLVDPDATFTGPVDLTSSETDAASSTTSTCSETDEQPQRKTLWNSHEDTTLINAACSGLYASPEEFARNRDDHEDLPGRSAASIRHRSTKLKLRWKKLKAVAEGNLNADDSPSTSPESPDPDYRPLSIKGKATTATSTSTSSAPTTQAGRKTKRARKEKAEDTIAEAKQAVIKAKIEFANQLRKGEEEKRRKAHQQQPSATTTGSAVGSVQQPLQHAFGTRMCICRTLHIEHEAGKTVLWWRCPHQRNTIEIPVPALFESAWEAKTKCDIHDSCVIDIPAGASAAPDREEL
ncbi:hypothetical protein PAPYR_12184 [Paratrimastix pyriformis]|uniref:Myb-like domain-containing protein n=1 Tax=Paratrimastix pyriformis TaxID=342808 RepID=A0ABQ8U2A2_9EUKA|nr:hypothetical protein PAPYR_12184 [Paratrimastix pyriformis]